MKNQTVFLTAEQMTPLKIIYDAFLSSADFSKALVSGVCDNLEKEDDQCFAKLYGAILHARNSQVDLAISLLKEVSNKNSYAKVLCEHLLDGKGFSPDIKVFQDSKPYAAWAQSNLAKNYMKSTVEQMGVIAKKNAPRMVSDKPVILDLGIGTGVLTTQYVNKIVDELGLKSLRLIGLDQSEDMLKVAKKYCDENIKVPFEWTQVCGKIQDLSDSQWSKLEGGGSIWFTNASLSLHHLPFEEKSIVMEKVASISKFLIITDIEANNDLPDQDTPEFVYSVTQLYRYIFDDIMKSEMSPEGERLSLHGFLFAESLVMLSNSREKPDRLSRHTRSMETSCH